MAGIGPVQYCATMLADMGTTVVWVDRPGPEAGRRTLARGRDRWLILDIKSPSAGAMAGELRASGLLAGGRGRNTLDGGAPQYGTYRCAYGKYLAPGALEELLSRVADPVGHGGRRRYLG